MFFLNSYIILYLITQIHWIWGENIKVAIYSLSNDYLKWYKKWKNYNPHICRCAYRHKTGTTGITKICTAEAAFILCLKAKDSKWFYRSSNYWQQVYASLSKSNVLKKKSIEKIILISDTYLSVLYHHISFNWNCHLTKSWHVISSKSNCRKYLTLIQNAFYFLFPLFPRLLSSVLLSLRNKIHASVWLGQKMKILKSENYTELLRESIKT